MVYSENDCGSPDVCAVNSPSMAHFKLPTWGQSICSHAPTCLGKWLKNSQSNDPHLGPRQWNDVENNARKVDI
jgi:hypothetical protein